MKCAIKCAIKSPETRHLGQERQRELREDECRDLEFPEGPSPQPSPRGEGARSAALGVFSALGVQFVIRSSGCLNSSSPLIPLSIPWGEGVLWYRTPSPPRAGGEGLRERRS